ncbi:MAG: transporter substrate-binding domain-containing protein [Clostridia bacterium]|nr:transporter substrate-binding domain-containing protein [Clostridia bacterium]
MKHITKIVTIFLIATLLALTLSTLTACQETKDPNKLYVGMECGYAPFNYTQMDDKNGAVKISNADGYANGYDVMIAKKIAQALGKELVIVKYEWDALVNGVATGALDFIIAGMSPTLDRLEAIDFSLPYYESQLVIVVRKDGNYDKATKLADFSGAKIVAQLGTFHYKALQAQCQAHNILRQTPMETFPAMINALNTKAIDGYVAEEPGAIADCAANSAFTYIHLVNNSTGFTASAEDVQIAIGIKKNSPVTPLVNAVLSDLSQEEREQMMDLAISLSVGDNITE